MRILFLDFESYGDLKHGSYRYVQNGDFMALLLSYCFLDPKTNEATPCKVHDFTEFNNHVTHYDGQELPAEVEEHIEAGGMVAGWSQFERVLLNKFLDDPLPHEQYLDVMIMSAEKGYPLKLSLSGKALKCPIGKDPVGKLAINKFCKPRKGERVPPEDDMELWRGFVHYCRVDTELMVDIYRKLPLAIPAEQQLHIMDMRMNDRGIRIDVDACHVLQALSDITKTRLNELLKEATNGAIETTGQVAKIAAWCGTLSAGEPALTAAMPTMTPEQRYVAKLRLSGAKISTAKIPKMLGSLGNDGRSRGMLQFCGTKTKRWAGRGWQPHNLPRESFKPWEFDDCLVAANRAVYEENNLQEFTRYYPDPLKAISMCLRGLIIPEPKNEFIIADYSAIEARVLAWYAQQSDIIKVYEEGGDVYKLMASSVFKIPEEDISSTQRFLGKTLVLGSGYGLGWKGLQRNLATANPVTDDEAKQLTYGYREKFSGVVLWWGFIMGALQRALEGEEQKRPFYGELLFGKEGEDVFIELATGNRIWYHEMRLDKKPAPWDENIELDVLTARDYRGEDNRYDVTHSIVAENICSMTAREIMARGMLRCEQAGYPPIMSVHDEVILEVPKGFGSLEEVDKLLCERPYWADPLPLNTEAFRAPRYTKD